MSKPAIQYDKDLLIKLVMQGKSNREIGDIMGHPPERVKNWVRNCGVAGIRRPPTSPEKVERCKTCIYREPSQEFGPGMHCGYLLVTGRVRGCHWSECDKYEKGKRRRPSKRQLDLYRNYQK